MAVDAGRGHHGIEKGRRSGFSAEMSILQSDLEDEARNIIVHELVLIYMWYMGHQTASFRDVGDRFDVTISSVNRIVRRLTLFLSNLSADIIKWPDENEKHISEEHFRSNGFPNVIGAIDGSHIKIDKPSNDPEMQAVCDHQRKIRDVFIGYPGSVHDSRDSGYPLQGNLLTPYKDRGNLTNK
ncbi:hypothetical protein NQ317_000614 [Molorchus minor]|uniref:Nuclease HARBI1 n=1 Tax=Molorchus minor TaxID=1323400 RepID=A0ABQ9JSD6_9CUCU|nr:hypothetical protein NQ317_000614 [Molorchus minor]